MGFFDYESTDNANAEQTEQVPVLQGLSENDWQMLIRFSHTIPFEAGELLLKTGETEDAVYIIVSGQVEVISPNSFGLTKRLALIEEGSVFGELAFFDQKPRSASIRAVSTGQVLKISHASFDKIAAWNPSLAQQFLFDLGKIIAHRFRTESPYKI